MGILSNTVSLAQYRVKGTPPESDLADWAGGRLAAGGFRSIEETTEELSQGWVHLDDFTLSSFDEARAWRRENYLVFTLRRDRRRVPAIILRAHLERAREEFLSANPGYNHLPREKKEDLRDAHRGRLLARTLPSPSTADVVWDTRSGLVTFTSLGTPALTAFEELFEETFPGLRLVPEHPFARAEAILPKASRRPLYDADMAGTEAVLERIEKNRWLGWDFLEWVLYRTMKSSAEYTVSRPGPLPRGVGFTAFIDERLVLLREEEDSPQKVTVLGPQSGYGEALAGLAGGKRISEANLHFQVEELRWSMTLRGERFHLASFKAPKVTVEKDNLTDAADEKEAVFYERMLLFEQGIQLLHSLYAEFLNRRLDGSWGKAAGRIKAWREGKKG
jgi:hypothetical protein